MQKKKEKKEEERIMFYLYVKLLVPALEILGFQLQECARAHVLEHLLRKQKPSVCN